MLHSTPLTIQAKTSHEVYGNATGLDSTSGGEFSGELIDRLALSPAFTHAQPFLVGSIAGTTSTGGERWCSVAVKLQHGDSSGGGDLADYSTGSISDAVSYYTTQGESTDWRNWTTGAVRVQTSPRPYPLLHAKRFLSVSGTVSMSLIAATGTSTATSSAGIMTLSLGANLLRADHEEQDNRAVHVGGLKDVFFTTSTAT